MKVTHASVQAYADINGLTPVQVDSIPEGFSFKAPDITISGRLHEGDYVALVPLSEWGESQSEIHARTEFGLLALYKEAEKVWRKK